MTAAETPSTDSEEPSSHERISPSAFMRNLRPELYSDSEDKAAYYLDQPVFEYHLETITQRNQTQAFEIFCRKLCERVICPNLRPQTGPEGGGDGKVDSETYPVADEISAVFVGDPNAGRERWAFAFSAKAKWREKIRDDVKGIIDTKRRYDRIICVTARGAKSKDRLALEAELSKQHGVPVTIHDRAWIVKEIIENDRKDIAFNYLGVGEARNDLLNLGPVDYSRAKQLRDIEAELNDSQAPEGMGMHRAAEALVAAKLSRNLEKPREETDGRFLRAIRLAKAEGMFRQKLESRYEHIWTAFWWFDDIEFLQEHYDLFEVDAATSNHTANIEFLCNLFQLLINCVVHGLLTREEAKLDARAEKIRLALEPLAANKERPNNALEAEAQLVINRMNWAAIENDPSALPQVWRDISTILDKAEGLGEFDASRMEKMIDVAGLVAGNDSEYTLLVEKLADFVSRRKSDAEGAIILLNRAKKLDVEKHRIDMIRLLGKAALRLSKKEYNVYLIEALYMLSVAYRGAGLLWAARAACIFAASSTVIEGEVEGQLPVTFVPVMKLWAWLAISLGHLPDYLYAIQLLNGAVRTLPLDDNSREALREKLRDFDMVLGNFFLNLPAADLDRLGDAPDILERLQLFSARTALLYVNGHERTLRDDGSLPPDASDEEVHRLLSTLASQPAAHEHPASLILNEADEQTFHSSVLGMDLEINHSGSWKATVLAEAILGSLEAFFGTSLDRRVMPHTERVRLSLEVTPEVEVPSIEVDRLEYSATLKWPETIAPTSHLQQKILQDFLLTVAADIFELAFYTSDARQYVEDLFRNDAVQQRMVMVTAAASSYHRVASKFVSRLSDWAEVRKLATYPPMLPRPELTITDLRNTKIRGVPTDKAGRPSPPDIKSHKDIRVQSIIDMHAWNQADWKGTGYIHCGDDYPPIMMLLFTNRAAAEKIFERWKARVGNRDSNDEIQVSIIRKIPGLDVNHYRILIFGKPPTDNESAVDEHSLVIISRSKTMEPTSSVNLGRFLEDYNRFGCYVIAPAIVSDVVDPWPIENLQILKRNLVIKDAADIGEHDLEKMAFRPGELGDTEVEQAD